MTKFVDMDYDLLRQNDYNCYSKCFVHLNLRFYVNGKHSVLSDSILFSDAVVITALSKDRI